LSFLFRSAVHRPRVQFSLPFGFTVFADKSNQIKRGEK
jgi:hypothetical protein